MDTKRVCQRCTKPLPADAPEGLCPACLVHGGLEASTLGPGQTVPAGAPADAASGLPVPPRLLPQAGQVFGGYRIVRELGRGGMGAVYDAKHLESGRRVALKVLSQQLDSPEARKRFLREGRLAASINHPNSVYVYGTEEIDGTPVISMELIAGGTLQQRVQGSGPMSVDQAVDAILHIISGLEAAQALGILHRDVKPSNCFEDADGTVKIGDFGLSISTAARADTQVTAQGALLGTPAFASPEQLRGEELNVRSDMYSVGVTLFYLLTARTPFEGHNVVQLIANVLDQPAPSPRKWRPAIPQGLARVVLRCLEKDSTERFKSYDELRQALAPFSSDTPVPAPLGIRFAAGVLDLMFFGAAGAAASLLAFGSFFPFTDAAAPFSPKWLGAVIASFAVVLLYYGLLEGVWGASAGKAICRLRLTGPNRNPAGVVKALLRASIYLFLPPLPYWIAYGFNPMSLAAQSSDLERNGVSVLYYVVLVLLFCTARRRNGLAAIHDLLTGTRVIRKPAHQARPVLSVTEEVPPAPETQPRVGPYHVLESVQKTGDGEWLLAYDTRLLRRVLVRVVPPGTPPVAPHLRNLGRVGRLRWITGRRSPTENWDAFEGVTGRPLVNLLAQRQPWGQVRFWLLDLANELSAAEKDGTLPAVLALDRVWITADGRAKLLDFPAPGAASGSAPDVGTGADAPRFLARIASLSLEGRIAGPERAAQPAVRVPLPLHARAFLEKLPTLPSIESTVTTLKPLMHQTAIVSRGRRAALVAACVAFPLVAGLGMIFAARVWSQWQSSQPEISALSEILRPRAMQRLPWVGNNIRGPDDQTLALYVAGHYRSTITNAASWNSVYAFVVIDGDNRRFAEESVRSHPNLSEEETRDATAAMRPYLPKEPGVNPLELAWFPFLVAGISLIVYVVLPALLAALLFRGGLLLRVFGVAVVRRDGMRASRLRMLWRGLVAWTPALLTPLLGAGLAPVLGETSAILLPIALLAGLALWSLTLPGRSLQDRIAGTDLVPR